MEKVKVILVTNIPNQYRVPLFNELNEQLISSGKELTVVFAAKNYQARKSLVDLTECNFKYQILNTSIFSRFEQQSAVFFYAGLFRLLLKEKPETVIVGGFSLASLKAALLQFFVSFQFIIWSGSYEKEARLKRGVRLLVRRFLVAKADGLIAYSSFSKQYFQKLGAAEAKLSIAGNTVDIDFFKAIHRKTDLDTKKGEPFHLTYVGYLSPRKNVELLLHVVKDLMLLRTDFVLDVVGDGECRSDLLNLAKQLNISSHVHFHGFKQKEELPDFLGKSAVFLFQTDFDIWGLVLNEAMAVGLPCLASIHAGAAEDLIQEGITGYKVDFREAAKVVKQIDFLLDHPNERKRVGDNARAFIQSNYSLKNCAEKMISAI